ncbi:hypothetical protein [Duganella hordei]|uniref:hypothetical protein n=1 Tax=Duganella hordei TaxID=2865934 RepID=UPI003340143D
MKQLHVTAKFACALILTAAAVTGCQKKEVDTPPAPEVVTPAPAPAPAATPPATDSNVTPPAAGSTPPADTPPPATPPAR